MYEQLRPKVVGTRSILEMVKHDRFWTIFKKSRSIKTILEQDITKKISVIFHITVYL